MSVWGGIGEGIAQGLKERMDREDQERRERTAQFNADRQFRFAQEQAARAQANADRTFEAQRSDADRNYAEGVRRFDIGQANADRTFEAQEQQRGVENERADYELALKGEAQDWKNKLNSEQLRGFQLANEELDMKRRKQREEEDLISKGGYKQTTLAAYRLLSGNGEKKTVNYMGKPTEAIVLDHGVMAEIYGKDNPWITDPQNGIRDIAMIDTDEGKKIMTIYNNGGYSILGTDQLYDMAKFAWGNDGVANAYFGREKQKRDMGMLQATERFKTDEAIRRDEAQAKARSDALAANDPYGLKRELDAYAKVASNPNATVEQQEEAIKNIIELASQMKNARLGKGAGTGRVQTPEEAARARAALEQKKASQKRITAPTAQKKVEQKTEQKKEVAKPTEKRVEQKGGASTSAQLRQKQVDERKRKEAEAQKNDDEEWGAGDYKVPQRYRGLHSKDTWKKIVDKSKERERVIGTGPKPVKSTFLGI